MKKIFTIAALAAMVLSANADVTSLYIAGAQGVEINGQALPDWDIVNTVKVDLNRGKFVMKIKNFTTISISDKKLETESWGDWQTGLWSYPDAINLTQAQLGKSLPLSGPGNQNLSAPWAADEWDVEISGDLKTITFNTTTPKPADTIHLLGDGKIGWGVSDKYKFENEPGTKVYWLDIPESEKLEGPIANMNIIKNNSWETWWGAPSKPLVFANPQSWIWKNNADGDNAIAAGSSYWGTIRFVMPENEATAEVTMFTEIKEHSSIPTAVKEIDTDENMPVEYFDFQGIRVNNPVKGIYIKRQGSKTSKVVIK